jgi:uncharacterized membrane protein YcfT
LRGLAYLGRHSLIIYLAFFIPMATSRILLIESNLVTDSGLLALLVTIAAVIGPLALNAVARCTFFSFLFERPRWARLERQPLPDASATAQKVACPHP